MTHGGGAHSLKIANCKSWGVEILGKSFPQPCVTCHMSRVSFQVSSVTYYTAMFWDTKMEGSQIFRSEMF